MIKIGYSHDIHQIELVDKKNLKKNYLKLGNTLIKSDYKVFAESDGDVLVHAITEAVFGALNVGSLGDHFTKPDKSLKNDFSIYMLKYLYNLLKNKRCSINNIDSLIIYEYELLGSYRHKMQVNIAKVLEIPSNIISVKFTRSEQFGETSDFIYIRSSAVVLLSCNK